MGGWKRQVGCGCMFNTCVTKIVKVLVDCCVAAFRTTQNLGTDTGETTKWTS